MDTQAIATIGARRFTQAFHPSVMKQRLVPHRNIKSGGCISWNCRPTIVTGRSTVMKTSRSKQIRDFSTNANR